MLVSCSPYSSTLKMEVTCSYKMPPDFHAGFLLALFFNPEDGGDMLLQNAT
jgi:hypothetical protein